MGTGPGDYEGPPHSLHRGFSQPGFSYRHRQPRAVLRAPMGCRTGFVMKPRALPAPASAAPLEHGTFHDEFSDIVEDFSMCPVGRCALTAWPTVASWPTVADGTAWSTSWNMTMSSETVTNLDNGQWIRDEVRTLNKDLRVTDNGDGRLTILAFGTVTPSSTGPTAKSSPAIQVRSASRCSSITRAHPATRPMTSDSNSTSSRNRLAELTTSAQRRLRH